MADENSIKEVKEIKPENKLSFYQGLPSSLNPDYGYVKKGGYFSGYRTDASTLSGTTNPQTANIIQEINEKLNTGIKNIELTLIQAQQLDAVPKQYFEEARRQAKLVNADITVHGPLLDPSGISNRGYSEEERIAIERQIADALIRVQPINPDGNVIVTFHSSVQLPAQGVVKEKDEKTGELKEVVKSMIVIDSATGDIKNVKEEIKHYPGLKDIEKGETKDIRKELQLLNVTKWSDSLNNILFASEQADRLIKENFDLVKSLYPKLINKELDMDHLQPPQQRALTNMEIAKERLRDVLRGINGLFDQAWKNGTDEDKKRLREISELYNHQIKKLGENPNPENEVLAIQRLVNEMSKLEPNLYKPLNEFAMEKSAQTFGNAAFQAYKKFGENTPVISIENPPAGTAFARAEELREMIEKSREEFVKKAVENGMDKSIARKTAEKLIGATWDVGHINMIRKFGFDEVDIIKETEKIAPFVKHVHLSDNFGMEHAELPMGMGNVPLAEMMKKLGKTGEKVKKVIEVGSLFQFHGIKNIPFKESLIGMGSPIYPMKSPYWNQTIGLYQEYYSGFGRFLPDINYETFGAGFSQLPTELGGSRQTGGRGRMSGTPME